MDSWQIAGLVIMGIILVIVIIRVYSNRRWIYVRIKNDRKTYLLQGVNREFNSIKEAKEYKKLMRSLK